MTDSGQDTAENRLLQWTELVPLDILEAPNVNVASAPVLDVEGFLWRTPLSAGMEMGMSHRQRRTELSVAKVFL